MKFKINYLTIIGIIIIAFGTYLIYNGSKIDSDKGQNQISQKLDLFSKKLESVKASNFPTIEKQKQLDTIKTQFDKWAKNLNENYPEIELLQKKQSISREEKEITVQKQWNILLNKTFENILEMIYSINKESLKNKIKIYSSDSIIPKDFFNEGKNYFLGLKFQPTVSLEIYIETFKGDYEYTCLRFIIPPVLNKQPKNEITLFINQQNFLIKKYGVFHDFYLSEERPMYPIKDLTKIIQEILSYEFILSTKKG